MTFDVLEMSAHPVVALTVSADSAVALGATLPAIRV